MKTIALSLAVLFFLSFMLALLPSCGYKEYPFTGSITYRDPQSGAKAGLDYTPGAPPRASVRVPVYDPQTGDLIGMAGLSTEIPKVDRSGK